MALDLQCGHLLILKEFPAAGKGPYPANPGLSLAMFPVLSYFFGNSQQSVNFPACLPAEIPHFTWILMDR